MILPFWYRRSRSQVAEVEGCMMASVCPVFFSFLWDLAPIHLVLASADILYRHVSVSFFFSDSPEGSTRHGHLHFGLTVRMTDIQGQGQNYTVWGAIAPSHGESAAYSGSLGLCPQRYPGAKPIVISPHDAESSFKTK